MRELTHHKVTELPINLEPNAIYFVKSGDGYDEYITSDVGTLITATPQNKTEVLQTRGTSLRGTISQNAMTIELTELEDKITKKADIVDGMGLTTNDFTDEYRNKLDLVNVNATVNSSDGQLRDRATHTGTQDVSTITGLGDGATKNVGVDDGTLMAGDDPRVVNAVSSSGLSIELDKKVDKVDGKGLTANDFTDLEKQKLASIEGSHFRGTFVSHAALMGGVDDPMVGDYGDVDGGIGEDVLRYIWDASDSKWVAQQSSAALTSSQVKQMYESNPDTNAFTDDQVLKLTGVEDEATKNSPDATLRDRATHTGTQDVSTITGLGDSARLDVGVGIDTVASGNDNRLSDDREWVAETISEIDAKAGISTERKAFTSQRVRQSTEAHWEENTGQIGREIVMSPDVATVRSLLGIMGGTDTNNLAISYTDGVVTSIVEDGIQTNITYNLDGTVDTVSYPRGAKMRTEKYTYTNGQVTGMTATEV